GMPLGNGDFKVILLEDLGILKTYQQIIHIWKGDLEKFKEKLGVQILNAKKLTIAPQKPFELIIKNTQKPLAVRAQRAISFRVATETDKLSVKLYIEQPILKNSFESFYESVIGLIHLTKMEKYNNKKDILAFKEIIEKFRDSTGKLIKTLKVVLEQSKSFLGISRNLNKSQYKYEKVTNILIDNISLGKLICDKIIELLNEKYYL
ncbi:unnamed protein product, partial [marine sediment metagenome]